MSEPVIYRCQCGAKGDLGELVEHAVSHLDAPDEHRPHGWPGEPERVTSTRDRMQARAAARLKLAASAGLSTDELREALR